MTEKFTPQQPEDPQIQIRQLTGGINLLKKQIGAIKIPYVINGISMTHTDPSTGIPDLPFGLTLLPDGQWGDKNNNPLKTQSVDAALAEFAVTTSSDLQAVHYQIDDVAETLDILLDEGSITPQQHTKRFQQAEAMFNRTRANFVRENKIPLLETLQQAMQEAINYLQHPPYIINLE